MSEYRVELKGKRFGKLIVIQFVCRLNKHSMFKCVCDCGKETIVTGNNLQRNHTTSCGCQSSKTTIGERTSTHKMRNHPLYNTWTGMINRCYWSRHNRSRHYKEKGVIVCNEWKNSFESFRDWALSNGWEKGLSIDRIDNNGNYEPSNCRWATTKQQSRNRSNNVWLTIDGVSKLQTDWATEYNVKQATIYARLKRGFTHKEAVFGKQ